MLGFVAWQLVGSWKGWVRRRVESISYETANAIRRRVSVDLRMLPEFLSEPVVLWGDQPIHYVPIAQLRKQRFVQFDLRDEQDRALPLVTRRRNSAITAAMLSAAAQSVVIDRLYQAESDLIPSTSADGGSRIRSVPLIRVPNALERAFWLIAYLNPKATSGETDVGALAVWERLCAVDSDQALPVEVWEWRQDDEGCQEALVRTDDWKALLLSDDAFVKMAYDAARLFMICVPLHYEEGQRRIVKFSYTDHRYQRAKRYPENPPPTKVCFARWWNRALDILEGLPRPKLEDWTPPLTTYQPEPMGRTRRLLSALGWTADVGKFETPALSQGLSYHLSVKTPNGIQIRRAELIPQGAAGEGQTCPPQRGNQTLRAVDMHVADPEPGGTANAYLHIRPESSLIVRAGFLCALLTAAALTLLREYSSVIAEHEASHAEAVVAALIVIPGLLTVLATRDAEHPLTTSMVFGVRILAMAPGVLAVLSAGLVVIGKVDSWFGFGLLSLAWAITFILGVGWILAARRRPDWRAI